MVQVQDPQDLQWIFETFGSYQILSDLIHPYPSLSILIYRHLQGPTQCFLVVSEETDGTFFSEAVESGRPMCLGEYLWVFSNNDHFIYILFFFLKNVNI